jgi:hypothetical protein
VAGANLDGTCMPRIRNTTVSIDPACQHTHRHLATSKLATVAMESFSSMSCNRDIDVRHDARTHPSINVLNGRCWVRGKAIN